MVLWIYNKLAKMDILWAEANRFLDELHPTNQHYLTKINDTKQYSAAPYAMGLGIRMYGKSTSLSIESMNRVVNTII